MKKFWKNILVPRSAVIFGLVVLVPLVILGTMSWCFSATAGYNAFWMLPGIVFMGLFVIYFLLALKWRQPTRAMCWLGVGALMVFWMTMIHGVVSYCREVMFLLQDGEEIFGSAQRLGLYLGFGTVANVAALVCSVLMTILFVVVLLRLKLSTRKGMFGAFLGCFGVLVLMHIVPRFWGVEIVMRDALFMLPVAWYAFLCLDGRR